MNEATVNIDTFLIPSYCVFPQRVYCKCLCMYCIVRTRRGVGVGGLSEIQIFLSGAMRWCECGGGVAVEEARLHCVGWWNGGMHPT